MDWYQPTVLLSTFTSRRHCIMCIWYSAPSSSPSSSAPPAGAAASSFLLGKGKQLVTSSVRPMSRPSSCPVTKDGSAS